MQPAKPKAILVTTLEKNVCLWSTEAAIWHGDAKEGW